MTDPLTGLYNRRYLNREAPGLLQQALASQKPLSQILLDLDHFKRINDTHGHVTGDQVLRIAASRMRAAVRPQDKVCRYGGEEFLVLLPDTGIELATVIAQRISHQLSQGMDCLQSERLTASIGISQLRMTENSLDATLERADQALYAAKDAGRNCIKTCA
jgi:diguanylate cyclase (GGDEF)-like protein